eukprot:COSAG06_NODE_33010_length_496_cov_6.193955_1_plen_22_part_10
MEEGWMDGYGGWHIVVHYEAMQ